MISRETIDDVKNRVDIVDVIGDFVSLKRSGQNYKALSPFSNEKTASFYVVPAKGIFKDFSSGKGGDAITFVMEHEGMSYVEAIRYLAKKYGVNIQEQEQSPAEQVYQDTRESLYALMNYAKDYYKESLLHSEEGKSIGLSYFRERGFNDRIIDKFELGYTLNEWDHFSKKALNIGYTEEMLDKAGLIVKKEGGRFYDRFRGRVIFPVHNLTGKVIAFGARILTKEKDQPKYINSPETEIYHKSNVLYGLYQAKLAIRREDFCFLVEGYTDVISMHLSDVDNVVASSGTALTEEQIKLIRRFTQNVTVLFDGDAAGIRAALRGIDMILHGGLNVRVLLLPDGDDPDSYSKKVGTTAFKQYLKDNSKDFISFKIDLLANEAKDPIKKAEAIREIVTSISLIPDAIKRSVYIQETSSLLKIQETVLFSELNKILIGDKKKQENDKSRSKGRQEDDAPPPDLMMLEDEVSTSSVFEISTMVQKQEHEAIRLLVNYAEENYEDDQRVMDYMLAELQDVEFTNPLYKSIYEAFVAGAARGEAINTLYFMEHGTSDIRAIVAELTTPRYEASKRWGEEWQIFFPHEKEILHDMAYSNVLRLKFRMIQKLIEDNLNQLKSVGDNTEEFEKYFTIQEQLITAQKELAVVLGIVIPGGGRPTLGGPR